MNSVLRVAAVVAVFNGLADAVDLRDAIRIADMSTRDEFAQRIGITHYVHEGVRKKYWIPIYKMALYYVPKADLEGADDGAWGGDASPAKLLKPVSLMRLRIVSSLATKGRVIQVLKKQLCPRLEALGVSSAEQTALMDRVHGSLCQLFVGAWLTIQMQESGVVFHCGSEVTHIDDSRLALGILQMYVGDGAIVPSFQNGAMSKLRAGR